MVACLDSPVGNLYEVVVLLELYEHLTPSHVGRCLQGPSIRRQQHIATGRERVDLSVISLIIHVCSL